MARRQLLNRARLDRRPQREFTIMEFASTAAIAAASTAQSPADYAAAVQAIKTYNFGDSRAPLIRVETLVKSALRSPQDSQAIARELAALLASDATIEAKRFVCRQMVLVGTAEQVPAIAPLLLDPQLSHMARYALEPMDALEAEAALIDALGKAPAEVKVGIINSLGARRSQLAAAPLENLAQDADGATAVAAKAALARIKGQ